MFGQQSRDSGPQMSIPTAKQSQMRRSTRGFHWSGNCVWIRGTQNHQMNPNRLRYSPSGSAQPRGATKKFGRTSRRANAGLRPSCCDCFLSAWLISVVGCKEGSHRKHDVL